MIGTIVVVGASLAGMHAAHTLRRDGFDGTITIVDADPNRPYDRPPLSKQVLAGEWEPERIVLPSAREDLGVEWLLGRRAMGIDLRERVVRLDAGDRLGYDGLVVATGAAARTLPGTARGGGRAPAAHARRLPRPAHGPRRRPRARRRRRRRIHRRGGRGHVSRPGPRGHAARSSAPSRSSWRSAATSARVIADLHRAHDVDVRLGVAVDGLEGGDRVDGVRLADGTVIPAEVVVVGIGVAPNTAWMEGSGLNIDDGVVCDETLLAAPGVVVAGDIARWPSARYGSFLRVEHWETAVEMGEAAGRRLLAGDRDETPAVFDPVPWFWSDQYDRKIQLAGRAHADDDVEVVIGALADHRFVALYGRDGVVEGVLGMNRPAHVARLRPLVEARASMDDARARAEEMA